MRNLIQDVDETGRRLLFKIRGTGQQPHFGCDIIFQHSERAKQESGIESASSSGPIRTHPWNHRAYNDGSSGPGQTIRRLFVARANLNLAESHHPRHHAVRFSSEHSTNPSGAIGQEAGSAGPQSHHHQGFRPGPTSRYGASPESCIFTVQPISFSP